MNLLVAEMRRSLKELDLGLKGELTITSDMEDLSDSLFFDQVTSSECMIHANNKIYFRCLLPGPSLPMHLSMVYQPGMLTCC